MLQDGSGLILQHGNDIYKISVLEFDTPVADDWNGMAITDPDVDVEDPEQVLPALAAQAARALRYLLVYKLDGEEDDR